MYKWLSAKFNWNIFRGQFFIALLLLSLSFAYICVEPAEKVYYFCFDQLIENLENMQYDGALNQYLSSEGTASFSFDLKTTGKGWRFLYVDFKNEGKPLLLNVQFLDKKDEILSDQEVLLQNGENEIQIPVQSFQKIKLKKESAEPFRFGLKNVELRRNQKYFPYKKFCFYGIAIFILFLGMFKFLYRRINAGQIIKNCGVSCSHFLDALKDTIFAYLPQGWNRLCRKGIVLFLLLYVTYVQNKGIENTVANSLMYAWIAGGLILILAGLSWEGDIPNRKRPVLSFFLSSFVILILISDLFVKKRFQYSGFCMLFIGGMFYHSWKSMKHPEELIKDFKAAYKAYFVLGICFCMVCRPVVADIHYSGFMTDAVSYGFAMLVSLLVFIDDFLKNDRCLMNGTGVCVSLYLIWATQKPSVILATAFVLICSGLMLVISQIKNKVLWDKKTVFYKAFGILLGMAAVLLLQKFLYVLPYKISGGITFSMDAMESVEVGVRALVSKGNGRQLLFDKMQICKQYLQNINLLGHTYLTKFHGTAVWAPNSFVMNVFRYGLAAGIFYAISVVLYWLKAISVSFKNGEIFTVGLAVLCLWFCMTEVTEVPFMNLTWYLLYFGIGSVLALSFAEENGRNG